MRNLVIPRVYTFDRDNVNRKNIYNRDIEAGYFRCA